MPSVGADQLAAMISHAVAPAFMLNAVLATTAILVNRISGVERLRRIREIDESDARAWLKREIVELRQRERLLNNALHLVVLAGIGVFLLLLFGFTVAFMGYSTNRRHLLIAALCFLAASLFRLLQDMRLSQREHEARQQRPPAG